jgi:hypothetical protein
LSEVSSIDKFRKHEYFVAKLQLIAVAVVCLAAVLFVLTMIALRRF